MDIVDPQIPLYLLPPGSMAKVVNSAKKDFRDLPSVITPKNEIISRWSPTLEERSAIVRGEDIFVTIISSGPINPFYVTVGMINWSK